MGCQDEMSQFRCVGCHHLEETEVKIATPFQRAQECGWWVPPPRGWLMLVEADQPALWACSPSCVESFDQGRAEDAARRIERKEA